MTNAEKFLKDGVDKEKFCYELARHLNATVGNDEARTKEFMAIVDYFLNCLCVPSLTKDERAILKGVNKKYYTVIGRDKDNDLYFGDNTRYGDKFVESIFGHLFQFIKNGEEYPIEELLNDNT